MRPAGRGSNYVIGRSATDDRLINVAAIRSTGLTASLGIADYVAGILPDLDIEVGELRPSTVAAPPASDGPWWRRTARHRLPASP